MSVELFRGSPAKFDSRTLNRTIIDRWTGRNKHINDNDSNTTATINHNNHNMHIII